MTVARDGERRRPVLTDWVIVVCCLAWALPVVVAVVRGLTAGWYPVFDEALIAVGARDVLTHHHRWVGTATSLSLRGVLANHPGPLQFDLVALPVRMFGSGAGLVIGVAAVNLAAGGVAIVGAARQVGRGGAIAATCGLSLLVWSAGNQVLIDPYNPTASMVPFFAVLVLGWAVAVGDRWALPWLVGWASFCVQANVAYVVTTVPIVVGALGVYLWRRRGRDALREVLVWCVPVGLLLWAQPIAEQLARGRDGNLARILRNAGNLEEPLGLVDGTRRTAALLAIWPGWGRGNFDGGYTGLFDQLPSVGVSVLAFAALLAVLVLGAAMSRRWLCSPATTALLVSAAAFVVVGWVGAARVPLSPFFGFLAHFVRWLWPIGAFTVVAVGLLAGRLVQRSIGRRPLAAVAVVATIGAVAIALPDGPAALDSDRFDAVRAHAVDLNRMAIERLPPSGVTVDFRPPEYSPFASSLVAALQEHGVPFAVTDAISLRQFDDRRPHDGWPVVIVASGFEALDWWDSAVACVSALDRAERAELVAARGELAAALRAGALSLSETGERFAASVFAPNWMAAVQRGAISAPTDVVETEEFSTLVAQGLIVPPSELEDVSERFTRLRTGLDDTTACVLRR